MGKRMGHKREGFLDAHLPIGLNYKIQIFTLKCSLPKLLLGDGGGKIPQNSKTVELEVTMASTDILRWRSNVQKIEEIHRV